jgi:hypothetical protein
MALFWKKSALVVFLVFCSVSAAAQAAPGEVRWGGPRGPQKGPAPASVGIATQSELWPKVSGVATVYYYIEPTSGDSANLTTAIQTFNTDFKGLIQWVQLESVGSGSPNHVDINLDSGDSSGECEANEGYEAMQGQPMGGSGNCTVTTLLHEMGHVIGLWHEQQRTDEASYVSVHYANAIKGSWSNFLPIYEDQQLLTPYDYASVMEYPSWSFSRNGGPVIETIPAGIPLQGADGVPAGTPADYSAADKEAIERLYGGAPTSVTVTSNPVGLQVIVDGETVTTPQTYNWALWSTHTLDVPSGVQTLSGDIANSTTNATFYYTYGRWNNATTQSQTIAVTPGNGSPAFPATSPQVATYSANFIQLVPYTASVYPSGEGTVSVSPQPKTYSGSSDSFFVARQEVTLTATPQSGWHFYEFNNAPYWLPGGLGANPKIFYVPDTGNPVDATAEFTNTPVYSVNVSPNPFSSNLYAYVDGNFSYMPKNFSHYYDNYSGSDWSAGSSHTISVDSPEYPYSANRRYAFLNWSDAGAQSHSITLPSTSKTWLATLTPEFAPATNFNYPPCGGAATLSPDSPTGDGFYPTGQSLTFTATPEAGWTFAGWTFDLTGTTSPASLTANDETLVFANFNTTNTPLTVTLLNPSSTYAGSPSFVMNIRGTGFTAQSLVSVNGSYLTPVYVGPTKLQVTVPAALVASPATFQVYVENFPSGWDGCAVFGYDTFTVGSVTAPAITAPAPGSTLTGSSATFTWTPGVWAADYMLSVGTTGTGSSNVYAGSATKSTSVTVSNIPTSGVPLYVTFGYLAGTWKYTHLTYTEYGSPTPPAMTSPAPESTLSGSTVLFTWSAGAGPIAYKLSVGTTQGAGNIYQGTSMTATSASVSGIPASGVPVYVTLYYKLGPSWEAIYYKYVEDGGPAMTSPAPGSKLGGSTATFTWNPGTGVSQYQLRVGTTGAGSDNIYAENTAGTSATVTGIPESGAPLYVRLRWEIGTTWYLIDYTYTEYQPPS